MSRTHKVNRYALGHKSNRRLPSKMCSVGPGGMGCSCCVPAPGKRKEFARAGKRKEKREAFRIEETSNGHDQASSYEYPWCVNSSHH